MQPGRVVTSSSKFRKSSKNEQVRWSTDDENVELAQSNVKLQTSNEVKFIDRFKGRDCSSSRTVSATPPAFTVVSVVDSVSTLCYVALDGRRMVRLDVRLYHSHNIQTLFNDDVEHSFGFINRRLGCLRTGLVRCWWPVDQGFFRRRRPLTVAATTNMS